MAERYPDVRAVARKIQGATRVLTEIYLLGSTASIPQEPFEEFPTVEKVIRIRERYRSIGRHDGQAEAIGFDYNGVHFSQDSFHVFPGLCAVDTPANVEAMFRALQAAGITTTRAGAYKPRTSPYDFQGHGQGVPAVPLRAGRQVRHSRHRHGDHPRGAGRRDPRRADGGRQPDRRDAADRHAQRAELRAAQGGRPAAGVPGPVQARHGHHARRVAQRLRVRRHRRQQSRSSSACAA